MEQQPASHNKGISNKDARTQNALNTSEAETFQYGDLTIPAKADPNVLRRAIANPHNASPQTILQLQRTYGNRAVMRCLGINSASNSKTSSSNSATTTIQRVYTREGSIKTDPEKEYEVLKMEVTNNNALNDVRNVWLNTGKDEIIGTIKRMMDESGVGSSLSVVKEAVGTKESGKSWNFLDKEIAVRTVLGEVRRPEGEKREKALADQVFESKDISSIILEGIRRYMDRLAVFIENLQTNGTLPSTFLNKSGKYGSYYQKYPSMLSNRLTDRTMGNVLASRRDEGENVQSLIAALKDITTQFWDWFEQESQKALPNNAALASSIINVPVDKRMANYVGTGAFNFIGPSKQTEDISTVRGNDSRINEKSETIKWVRSKGMLVCIGPSFSTGRLLQLGTAIGAKPSEQEAVALAIFAFWNRQYWRSMSGIHHFHFVMDMLENYVPGRYKLEGYPQSINEAMSNQLKSIKRRDVNADEED